MTDFKQMQDYRDLLFIMKMALKKTLKHFESTRKEKYIAKFNIEYLNPWKTSYLLEQNSKLNKL